MRPLILLAVLSSLSNLNALASAPLSSPAPASRFQKLQAVLEHLGISEEATHAEELKSFDGAQTRQGFETILKYMDPYKILQRYLRWDANRVTVYRDRDTRSIIDYSLAFKRDGHPTDRAGLLDVLRQTATNPGTAPLRGLRIALDPGHMGGSFYDARTRKIESWDVKTGKYVKTGAGKVSEGEIALYTCMLLSVELSRLGADVMVTRRSLGAVSEEAIDHYSLEPSAEAEILSRTDSTWFDGLLASHPLGSSLLTAVDASPVFKRLRSEAMRDTYFISRVDLRARAEKLNAFRPHLTVVVHFDANDADKTQNGTNQVRGYVPGALLSIQASGDPGGSDEVASREQRDLAMRTLLDGHRWVESNVFTTAVVNGISKTMGLPIQNTAEDYKAVKVASGVYARNLALNRLVNQGVMSYVEVEHYDYTPEFRRLAHKDKHASIGGMAFDYPSRLEDVAEGIKKGILDYVASMSANQHAPRP